MDAEQLKQRIDSFPSWNYRFELPGGLSTPVASAWRVRRAEQRRRYFFEPLLGLAGGTLRGRRVLDLGCNAGFWSLEAIDAGAEFVLGVDGSETAIEQAELIFEARGVAPERYAFQAANVFDGRSFERFDVVLCLGLLDVVAKPLALFELIASAQPELVVIDTGISRARGAMFELSRLNEPRNAVERDLVLVPTRRAVAELAGRFGFDAVALAQDFDAGELGVEDYLAGRRIAFVCSKGVPLDALAPAGEAHSNPWVGALAAGVGRTRRKLGR